MEFGGEGTAGQPVAQLTSSSQRHAHDSGEVESGNILLGRAESKEHGIKASFQPRSQKEALQRAKSWAMIFSVRQQEPILHSISSRVLIYS